jgi:hypothetical protein
MDVVEIDGASRQSVRVDGDVRVRLREVVDALSEPPVRSDALSGVLVEADFERGTARLRTPTESGVQVEFTDELADDIHAALRHPATLRGDVVYDTHTHVARSVSLSVIERGEQLDFGLDVEAFWLERSFEDLAREQASGEPVDPDDLFDDAATDDERDAILAALDEIP